MIFRITHLGNVFVTTKEYVYSLIEKDRERGYKVLVLGTKETPRIKGVDFVRTKEAFRRALALSLSSPWLSSSNNKKYDTIYNLTKETPWQDLKVTKFISVVSEDYIIDLLKGGFLELSSNAWKNPLYK